ncbi:hypothetical protein [Lysinibacillus xylanilyticus]|uniref:hypothetical protein n=1 Tax=Lysinibacillus xylanilyticus TaxID=582475 RepID=UPI0036DF7FAA
MRQDKVIFSGENPFLEFSKCRELTVVLGHNKFMFVATLNSVNIMSSHESIVTVLEGTEDTFKDRYTIPLSLVLPLFKLDTKEKDNVLVLETASDKVRITYNDISVDTDIFSPNGLTLQQINNIDTVNSLEVDPKPFIQMVDIFGKTENNFCNVDGNTLFISDDSKCLLNKTDVDYQRKFSLSVQFIRLMKSMNCVKLFIGDNIVAQTKSGLLLITNLTKITNPNILSDYKFANRVPSDNIYNLNINKYLKHINIAVQTAELSATLDLNRKRLSITSNSNEKTLLQLTDAEVQKEGEFDFFSSTQKEDEPIVLTDPRLIKSLASFGKVKIKVCPAFLLAQLSKTHRLMFSLGKL